MQKGRKKIYKFPKNFLWGTATSAHQTEGNNSNSDWWRWEQAKSGHQKHPLDTSGIACDSYHRYEEDFDLCNDLNNNAVRISVEWARLEPKEGVFDEEEFEHYEKVLRAAKKRGFKTFVTLHHFTNPLWFSKKGGWSNLKSPFYFKRYAKKCAEELGSNINFFLTINEPQVYIMQSYLRGIWPPNKRNIISSFLVYINMIRAHNAAYKSVKGVNLKYKIGIVKNIVWFKTKSHPFDKVFAKILNFFVSDFFLLPIRKQLDLIGLNFYFTTNIKNFKTKNPDNRNSDLGWWIESVGLEKILLKLKRYKMPVYVTENGLADSKDILRRDFIRDMLVSCAKAIQCGADLRGYFHWSLLDNFEWAEGFWPKFGLYNVDRKNNLKRIARSSSKYYAKICKDNLVLDDS